MSVDLVGESDADPEKDSADDEHAEICGSSVEDDATEEEEGRGLHRRFSPHLGAHLRRYEARDQCSEVQRRSEKLKVVVVEFAVVILFGSVLPDVYFREEFLQEIVHGGHAAFEQNINQKQYQTTFDKRACIFSHVRKKIRRPKEEGAGVTGYSNIVAEHETAGRRHDTADDDVEGYPPFELRVAIHGVGDDDRRHG